MVLFSHIIRGGGGGGGGGGNFHPKGTFQLMESLQDQDLDMVHISQNGVPTSDSAVWLPY